MRVMTVAVALVAMFVGLGQVSPVHAATLTGTVQSGGTEKQIPRAKVLVTLWEATLLVPINRGFAKTDANGHFSINTIKTSTNSIFFAVASGDLGTDMVTIIGPTLPESITINELTTVAASYSMAQFFRLGYIAGSDFQLQLAAGMNNNIVSPITGESSDVLTSSPNADETESLRMTRSLSNLVAACVKNPLKAWSFYQLTRTPAGLAPWSMPQALANLARNPGQNVLPIYGMTLLDSSYSPPLRVMCDSWTVTVKVNNSGSQNILFGGPAHIAFDSKGYAWVANNVCQGTPYSSHYIMVLKPNGQPSDGTNGTPLSPIKGGGIYGVGYGVTIDTKGSIWFGNFGWGGTAYQPSPDGRGSVAQLSSTGVPISGSNGYQGGADRVQGITSDRDGNIWMASYGNDQLVVYLNGNPNTPTNFPQKRDSKPFDVRIAADGTAWLSCSGGFSGAGPCSVSRYRLKTDPKTNQKTIEQIFITDRLGRALKAVGIDSFGDGWIASQGDGYVYHVDKSGRTLGQYDGGGVYHPWGLAIDGEDNVWVGNFGPLQPGDVYDKARVSKLCGSNPLTRPPLTRPGDPISPSTGYTCRTGGDPVLLNNSQPLYGPGTTAYTPLMRMTSVNIDQAGNLWAVNNWKPDFDVDVTTNPGGDGIVIFVGLASPPKKTF